MADLEHQPNSGEKLDRVLERLDKIQTSLSTPRRRQVLVLLASSSVLAAIVSGVVSLITYYHGARQEHLQYQADSAQRTSAEVHDRTQQGFDVAVRLTPIQDSAQTARIIKTVGAVDARTAAAVAAVHPSASALDALQQLQKEGLIPPADSAVVNRVITALDDRASTKAGEDSIDPMAERHHYAEVGSAPARHGPAGARFEEIEPPTYSTEREQATDRQDDNRSRSCGMWRDAEGNLWCGGPCMAGQLCGTIKVT